MAIPNEYLESMCYSKGFNIDNNLTVLSDSCVDLIRNYPVNPYEITIYFKQALIVHLDKINALIDMLYQIKSFNDEFHKGCSVKNMADYILEDDQLLVNHASFLLDILDKFIFLCKFKANNLFKLNDSEVKKEYNKLSVEFREDEKYFYLHIYQPGENYDEDFLDNMSNLLVG